MTIHISDSIQANRPRHNPALSPRVAIHITDSTGQSGRP